MLPKFRWPKYISPGKYDEALLPCLAGIVLYTVHVKKGKADLFLAHAMRLNRALAYPENRRRLKPSLVHQSLALPEALRSVETISERIFRTIRLQSDAEPDSGAMFFLLLTEGFS